MKESTKTLKKIEYSTTATGINVIELYFIRKPRVDFIVQLKNAGFHWHTQKKCWYAKIIEETELIVQALNNWNLESFEIIAQKIADKRYYEKTGNQRERAITLHIMADERADIDQTLQEHNITAIELFRKAIQDLKKDSYKKD